MSAISTAPVRLTEVRTALLAALAALAVGALYGTWLYAQVLTGVGEAGRIGLGEVDRPPGLWRLIGSGAAGVLGAPQRIELTTDGLLGEGAIRLALWAPPTGVTVLALAAAALVVGFGSRAMTVVQTVVGIALAGVVLALLGLAAAALGTLRVEVPAADLGLGLTATARTGLLGAALGGLALGLLAGMVGEAWRRRRIVWPHRVATAVGTATAAGLALMVPLLVAAPFLPLALNSAMPEAVPGVPAGGDDVTGPILLGLIWAPSVALAALSLGSFAGVRAELTLPDLGGLGGLLGGAGTDLDRLGGARTAALGDLPGPLPWLLPVLVLLGVLLAAVVTAVRRADTGWASAWQLPAAGAGAAVVAALVGLAHADASMALGATGSLLGLPDRLSLGLVLGPSWWFVGTAALLGLLVEVGSRGLAPLLGWLPAGLREWIAPLRPAPVLAPADPPILAPDPVLDPLTGYDLGPFAGPR